MTPPADGEYDRAGPRRPVPRGRPARPGTRRPPPPPARLRALPECARPGGGTQAGPADTGSATAAPQRLRRRRSPSPRSGRPRTVATGPAQTGEHAQSLPAARARRGRRVAHEQYADKPGSARNSSTLCRSTADRIATATPCPPVHDQVQRRLAELPAGRLTLTGLGDQPATMSTVKAGFLLDLLRHLVDASTESALGPVTPRHPDPDHADRVVVGTPPPNWPYCQRGQRGERRYELDRLGPT